LSRLLNAFFLPPCFLWKPFENWGSAPDPAPAGGFFFFLFPGTPGEGERREGEERRRRREEGEEKGKERRKKERRSRKGEERRKTGDPGAARAARYGVRTNLVEVEHYIPSVPYREMHMHINAHAEPSK